jgi:hypothetical protein
VKGSEKWRAAFKLALISLQITPDSLHTPTPPRYNDNNFILQNGSFKIDPDIPGVRHLRVYITDSVKDTTIPITGLGGP